MIYRNDGGVFHGPRTDFGLWHKPKLDKAINVVA